MATLIYELDETYSTITRPVVMSIIRQISRNMKITKDIPICYPGANGKLYTWNAGVQKSQDAANFHQQEKMQVQVKEDYVEEEMLTMNGRQPYWHTIFNDRDIGIRVYPVYSRQKVTISFTYQAQTRYQAESFRDNWRRAIANNREHMVFFAEYKYPIPEVIEDILYLLYQKRKTYRKEYPKFQDYLLSDKCSTRVTTMTNAVGKGDILAVEEVQQDIIGNFTDSMPAEAEKDDRGSVWTVSFDYEFHYDKVISIGIEYPIIVDNQLVDPVLYPETPIDLKYLRNQFMNTQKWNYYNIQNMMGTLKAVKGAFIKIPEFDDWSVAKPWKNFQPLLSALLTVDPEIPREVCNLKEMGEWGLHETLAPYFSKYHDVLNILYEFPFYVAFYVGDSEHIDDDIRVEENLDVYTKHDMSVFKQYHLVIHALKDIKLLTKEGQKRFFSNPALVYAWMDIRLGYKSQLGYPKINAAGWIDIADFERIMKYENVIYNTDKRPFTIINPGQLLATVGIFSIVTHDQQEWKDANS